MGGRTSVTVLDLLNNPNERKPIDEFHWLRLGSQDSEPSDGPFKLDVGEAVLICAYTRGQRYYFPPPLAQISDGSIEEPTVTQDVVLVSNSSRLEEQYAALDSVCS